MAHMKQDEIDRVLDAALAKYVAAEPRPGLEKRVLANLRAERARVPDRAWWRWSVAGAVAAIIVVAVALAWRSSRPTQPVIADHPSATTQGAQEGTQVVSTGNGGRSPERSPARKVTAHDANPPVAGGGNPKLDQFPSPQPLSDQEKILQNYVAEYPQQAVLLARARSEALRRDQLEEMKSFPASDQAADSEERNEVTTER